MFFRATALRACALGRISVCAVVLDGCREGGGGATARADCALGTCIVESSDRVGFVDVGNGGKPEEMVSSTRGLSAGAAGAAKACSTLRRRLSGAAIAGFFGSRNALPTSRTATKPTAARAFKRELRAGDSNRRASCSLAECTGSAAATVALPSPGSSGASNGFSSCVGARKLLGERAGPFSG